MKRNDSYLGIDCGSASVKLALINDREDVLNHVYLRNKGLIETVKEGLEKIVTQGCNIEGVGVTGSGREFIKLLVGADITKTEVLAHTVGVLKYYPDVNVISDIGGEDAKLMFVNNGILEDFILNQSCSAGTGSSLEAIATRMGISIEDVSELALQSTKNLNISTKCGVFMTSAAVTFLNSGAKKEDILMGVIRGMVANYFTMAQGKMLTQPHIYTGMTAKNEAIVHAFKEFLGYDVIVPKYAPIMGAIGMALISKRESNGYTSFKKDVSSKIYHTKLRVVHGCENNCELTELWEGDKYVGCMGNRCEKCVKGV